ncbi:MAG: NAD-binding protein [Anaerolineales bacterium]|nr:NAD-binding protein [Anaerolineales bacterium]
MKIIIMGCGRVGGKLALLMEAEGHDVAVIEYKSEALARLGPNFKGRIIPGVGFDRDVLKRAGIEQADAFAATSSSDNANIVAARIARNIFHVPRVVARLFDPDRAEVYRRLGLLTISSTSLGAERIRELILYPELDPNMTFGGGEVCVVSLEPPSNMVGRMVKDLVISGEFNVVAITREGKAFIPTLGTVFRKEDIIHLAVMAESMQRFKDLFGLSSGG